MTFQTFTGKDYLKIDIANNYGLDKKTWDERISWFDKNEHRLGALVKDAEEPALFYAGSVAWQKTKAGKPTGYPISLDATCSGIQILACLAGDRQTASLVNVVDTGKREDAYTSLYQHMVEQIGDTAKIERKQTKQAIMTSFYGSTAIPKTIFGDGALLDTFHRTMEERAPGAWDINQTMLAIWDDTALEHDWVMPDNFHVQIKVMGAITDTVHFLNEPFDVTFKANMPVSEGRSLSANMVHSLDGMLVREMGRRCNYDMKQILKLCDLFKRGVTTHKSTRKQDKLALEIWGHYLESGFLSARILDVLDEENIGLVNPKSIMLLIDSLPQKPFEVLSVHDCFRCLPNYGNDLRRQYNNLLAELAESDMLSFLVSQIRKEKTVVNKLDSDLGRDIRETNYALS